MWPEIVHPGGILKKKKLKRKKERTDLWLPRGRRGGGVDWEFGVSRCKLLHIEWINNKVLLYSTKNYIQYPEINHKEKNIKKDVYIYV